MGEIHEGVCVFANLYYQEVCTLKGKCLGCDGKVEKCRIPKEKEEALDLFFMEMEGDWTQSK